MLDGAVRQRLEPILDRTGRRLAKLGVTANAVTVVSCFVGLGAAALIANGWLMVGLLVMVLSRIGDGLDGAVARASRGTDFGGFLDIVLDFVFYGAIPFAFILHDPGANAIAGAALIFAFYINGASFLAYAVVAEKRRLSTRARGVKSIYFTTGLAEATETLAVFILACLWPAGFPIVAWVFAAVCLYTAVSRIMLARATFAAG
ncbi:phosphatidylglycerophosphate synthase [Hoeflea marina]|uniref:Phosphatidylglycerophosphate synthase n=1 Tax=Hoeflea marina TaxID=274592 RepID=A0A317PHM2_9HYPH|nr:CDP-alcohol phosphatidyltransferase family protein [Hoeflea marina]PWV99932.1 phosphatidylglycerophosphate synthase [Hoeflea marina]